MMSWAASSCRTTSGSGGCQPQAAVGSFGEAERVSLGHVQPVQDFLGQRDAERVANLAELAGDDHSASVVTCVITCKPECSEKVRNERVRFRSTAGRAQASLLYLASLPTESLASTAVTNRTGSSSTFRSAGTADIRIWSTRFARSWGKQAVNFSPSSA